MRIKHHRYPSMKRHVIPNRRAVGSPDKDPKKNKSCGNLQRIMRTVEADQSLHHKTSLTLGYIYIYINCSIPPNV